MISSAAHRLDDRRAPTARRFDRLPDAAAALDLLRALNARAPGGAPVTPRGPLWLYGAGALGKLARSHCDTVGLPIAGVVDRNAAAFRNDSDWQGLAVWPPADVPRMVRAEACLAIAVATSPYVPITAALAREGWADCVPFYDVAEAFRDRHPLGNGWFAEPLDFAAMTEAGTVLSGFADDASRAHYLRFAAWRLARQELDFLPAPVTGADRFFIPEIMSVLRPGERFVDVGAHHGSVTARLLEETGGTVSAVWAVEPDSASRAVLEAFVAGLPQEQRKTIRVLDAVLGARAEDVRFREGLGYASQIAPGGTPRRATTLDALGLDPTFVKLHLEGAELATLEGGLETLRRHRPIVVLTCYHDAAGLIATPRWLMESLPGYSVLMRTHAWCGTGAVLYAIPEERAAR